MSDAGSVGEDGGECEDAGLGELQSVESSLRSAQSQCMSGGGVEQEECGEDEAGVSGDGELDELCSPVSELGSVQERATGEGRRGGGGD